MEERGLGTEMTPAEIDALPAGPEFDRLVAEKVLGREVAHRGPTGNRFHDPPDGAYFFMDTNILVPPYSTSDAAALEVLKKLKNEGRPISISTASGKWSVYVAVAPGYLRQPVTTGVSQNGSLALAICRAVLKAALSR